MLLPLVLVYTAFLIACGVPQTLAGYVDATTLEGAKQTIALGPVAFQEAIKLLGTNGGGFFNANSAHPFENPTALSNVVETWSEIVIPFALAVTFGEIVKDRRQGFRAVLDDGDPDGGLRGVLLRGRGAGQPAADRSWASIRRWATWRARRCGSAPRCPRCSR